MQYRQLELDLWQELELAGAVPQTADFKQLCNLLEGAIASLPQSQQLVAAADAISQLAQIYARRAEWLITTWEEAHTEVDTTLPVLSSLDLDAWVRQSMSVNLDAFVQLPVSQRQRQKRSQTDFTNSVAGEVEKENLLQAFESQINASDLINQSGVDATVDSENVALWTSAIARWMQQCQGETVSLLQLQQGVGMPLVDIWLGLLLSGGQMYEWETRGDFYNNAREIWLRHSLNS